MLYKERAYLMLPSVGEENRFLVRSERDSIDFYIGSTSLRNLETMKNFFSKMYDCYITDDRPEMIYPAESMVLLNRKFRRKSAFSYFPGFMKSLIYLPSEMDGISLQYEVIIRSSKTIRRRKRYNFCTYVRYGQDDYSDREVRSYVENEIGMLSREKQWKLRMVEGPRARFRSDLLDDPSILSNFVRVPIDEGL